MSKAATLPPWEIQPSWEKRQPAPTQPAPIVQRVRFAPLENTLIPPIPPPPPGPVSTPLPQQKSNAHRRAISLPKNPRPVRPKVPTNPPPIDTTFKPENDTPTINATETTSPIPLERALPSLTRTRSRSFTLPGTVESSATSASSTRQRQPLNTSYPSPPFSNRSPTLPSRQLENNSGGIAVNKSLPFSTRTPLSPSKHLENVSEGIAVTKTQPFSSGSPLPPSKQLENNSGDTTVNKSLPSPPKPDILPYDTTNTVPPPPARKSRFDVLKRSLSLRILPQNSNNRTPSATLQSPDAPTPDLPISSTVGPSRSVTSARRPSKTLASPNFNEEVFAWIQTDGSRIVAIPDNEKDATEYLTKSTRISKSSTGSGGSINASNSINMESVRSKSRRLASPGYIKEKYSLVEVEVIRAGNAVGDVVVSGGRSPGIQEGTIPKLPLPDMKQNQTAPVKPDDSTFDILDMYEDENEAARLSPKPELPAKDSTIGPKLIPLKYASDISSKEAPPGQIAPKLIPLKFLSPPSPEESEDESCASRYQPADDVGKIVILPPPPEVAPLRIKSRENTPTFVQASPKARTESTNTAPTSLTAYLLSHSTPKKLYNATHSTFLRSCTDGRLTLSILSQYLTQERLFLQNHLRFLSLLLANVSVAPKPRSRTPKADMDINARLTPHLITQLSYTQSQLAIFSSLAVDFPEVNLESWEEGTEDGMTDATRMLDRLFDVIGSAVERGEKSALVGVVVFWARENARLQSWKEVSAALTSSPIDRSSQNHAAQVITQYLVPCWSGPETMDLMDELLGLLNEVWGGKHLGSEAEFVERGEGRGKIERSWELDLREFEEMFEMVLGILGRGWREVVADI